MNYYHKTFLIFFGGTQVHEGMILVSSTVSRYVEQLKLDFKCAQNTLRFDKFSKAITGLFFSEIKLVKATKQSFQK